MPDRPRDAPQVYDFVDTEFDEKIQEQQDIIDAWSAIHVGQKQEIRNRVAPRFVEALPGELFPVYQKAINK